MMEATNRLDREPKYRRHINRLRSLCSQWRDDISFVRNGGTIYFAVDVDVIDMYLNPPQNASYGEILGRDPQTGQLVARLMGDSIFLSSFLSTKQGLSTPNVLLLIPPHDQELLYQLWGIARRVQVGAAAVSDPTFQALSSIFEQYKRDRAGASADLAYAVNNLLKRLTDHVPQLVALFDEAEGDAAALKRFSSVDPARLLNVFNLRRENGEYFILRSEEEFRDEISSLISDWEARLAPHARDEQPREALATDARVLATIQHINKTLCSINERLVLITGSRYLFRAMETADVPNLSEEEINLRKEFQTTYLRHPQWIMSNRNFFRTIQGEGDSGIGQRPLGLERLLELMAPLDGGSPQTKEQDIQIRTKGFAQVQESWNDGIKALAAVKYGPGLEKANTVGAITLANIIKELQEDNRWSVDNLRKQLLSYASALMNVLVRDSSSLGLLDVLAEPTRMMPALCFDTPYDEFNHIYKKLLEKMIDSGNRGSSQNSSALRELIATVNKDSNGKDRDPYHVHILHAAAFAARGHWRQVLTLCDNAIRIANGLLEEARAKSPDDEKGEYRKGREAAYLAAIARRRSARNSGDLNTAEAYLDLAKNRKNVDDPKDLQDLRFDSEGLAISNRRIYFNYFDQFLTKIPLSSEERDAVCQQAQTNTTSLLSIINRAKTARDSVESTSNGHYVADWVLRQCFTNLFDLALIRSELEKVAIQAYELDQLFKKFKNSIKREDESCDHHAWLLSKVVGALFHSNEPIAGILEEISKSKKAHKPTPYETERLALYERLINEYVKE